MQVRLDTQLPVSEALARVGDSPIVVEADFSDSDLTLLAARLDIPSVSSVSGPLELRSWRGKGLSLRGSVNADVVQTCVITLEPVEQWVSAEVDLKFFPGADPLDMDSDIDPLPADTLALGEIYAEQIALALDPYPRQDGAEFAPIEDNREKESPFAALQALKRPES